jgi:hypothetical protein
LRSRSAPFKPSPSPGADEIPRDKSHDFAVVYRFNSNDAGRDGVHPDQGKATTLHRFGNFAGGRRPSGGALTLGPDDLIYGTCFQGGRHPTGHLEGGMGTVYRFAPWPAGR